jgi:excisionase family DNA binding protein
MQNSHSGTEPIFITVKRAATLMELTPRYVYQLIQRGKIPQARHFGRVIRIHREAFMEWLNKEEKLNV